MSTGIERAVLAAERARCEAMLANDGSALDAILDPRLHFSHATGAVDDKAAYLAKMTAGRITYISIDWSEDRVTPLGENAALLTGRMTSVVSVEGVQKRLDNRVMSAWGNDHGQWRVVAFQSTPLAG
jgi:hypothetical protein